METSRYRALLKSVELGSFSKAAQELAYTPSGVSQLISALEKDLRFPVLERMRNGVRLTENGQRRRSLIATYLRDSRTIHW